MKKSYILFLGKQCKPSAMKLASIAEVKTIFYKGNKKTVYYA